MYLSYENTKFFSHQAAREDSLFLEQLDDDGYRKLVSHTIQTGNDKTASHLLQATSVST